MNQPAPDPSRLPSPGEVQQWLDSTGWRRLGANDLSALYEMEVDGRATQVLVPVRADLVDYEDSIRAALAKAALVTGRPLPAVMSEAGSRTGRDVVSIKSETETPGVISLADGAAMWNSSRSMILASAASAVAPRPAFGSTLRPASAEAYLDQVEASVLASSFVVVLNCPTEPDIRSNVLGQGVLPYGRLVTAGLARAVQASVEVASDAQRRSSSGVWADLVREGVSADLLDALMQVVPRSVDEQERELAIDFSPTIYRPPVRIELAPGLHNHLGVAAEQLRRAVALVPAEVRGAVTGLERRQRGGTEFTVTGTIGFRQAARSTARAKVVITADIDEAMPIRAYANRTDLILEGSVRRRGRTWTMPQVMNVSVAQPPSEPRVQEPFPGL